MCDDFPAVPAGATVKWIPKGLARRYAACRLRIIDWSVDAETHQPRLPAQRVAAWSKLNLLFPYLILHEVPRTGEEVHAPQQVTSVSTRKAIQHRIELAEAGEYGILLTEAAKAERLAAIRAAAAPLRERTRNEQLAAAVSRAEDGCLRTAARLLLGGAILPSTPQTADAVEKLYRLNSGPPLPRRRNGAVRHVTSKVVMQRLHRARGSAHPGLCGERNTHLQALLASPHAAVTLTRWVNTWLLPELSQAFRAPWMSCGLIPLDKGEGKPRPIVFQECLLKVATGAIVDTNSADLRSAAGSWQRGVYHPGGTVQLVWDLRAAMASRPHEVMTAIDCRNAFGEAFRAPAAEVASSHCPGFERLLQNLWSDIDATICTPDGPGSTRNLHIQDGFVQGGCEAAPAFALTLRAGVDAFFREASKAGLHCHLWAYMDDMYMQCRREDWHQLMDLLTAALAAVGLTRRADKCHCFIPSLDPGQVQLQAPAFAPHAQLHGDGLPALGTTADGQYSIVLGVSSSGHGPTEERLARAEQMCAHLVEMCDAPTSGPRRHPAWRILDSVVNHCLSYDASVNEPDVMTSYGRRLDKLVSDTAAYILAAAELQEAELQQLRLSRDVGGCGLRSAEDRCHTAFLAAVLRLGTELHAADHRALAATGVMDHAKVALANLRSMGIELDVNAMPHAAVSPPPALLNLDELIEHPLPKRQRAWWAQLDRQRAAKLAQRDRRTAKRIESCSGPEGGAYLRGTRADLGSSLTDNEFVIATRYRVGMRVMASGICHHSAVGDKSSSKRICSLPTDTDGLHAVLCKTGGTPYAAHGQGCDVLLRATQASGYQAKREQIIPELATPTCKAPQIDVEGWSLQRHARLLIDFSIRHPHSSHYSIGQEATVVASKEKDAHYTGRQGLQVWTAAMETYGRHGNDLADLLAMLADLARQRDRDFGRAPQRWLRKWRIQLSAVAAKLVGRAVQQACDPGTCFCS